MNEERLHVLVLDDETSLREPLAQYLQNNFGYHVQAAANGEQAIELMKAASGRYDVALIDQLLMPGPDGVQVMQEFKRLYPEVECIIFTGWGSEHRQRALQAGAFRYLEKPFDYDELAMLIRTAAQQVRLRAISRDVLSKLDVDQVLAKITAAACSLALADEATIVLLDKASNKLLVHAETTYPVEQCWHRHFKDQRLSMEIIHSGQVVSVPDIGRDDRADPKFARSGICSFIGVPTPGEGGNLGVLYVYSKKPGHFDNWGTVALVQTLAGHAGLAIANAQAVRQIRAHASYMEKLVQAGQGFTQATKLEDQLALAWDFAREQLQVSTFFIALYDKATDMLTFPLFYDKGQAISVQGRRLGTDRASWGISGYVAKTGEEHHWPTGEAQTAECTSLGITPSRVGDPCQSCFYLPLKTGGQTTGVISIQSYTPRAFTPILLDACRALGSQLAVALENARLFSELTEAKEWREALIENAFDAVIAIDQEGKITTFNQRAEEMLGRTAREMANRTVAPLHANVEKAREIFDVVNQKGTISGWEVTLRRKDGALVPALLSATLIRDNQGRPIGQAGFMRDLRQVNLLEERLRALIRVSQAITSTLDLDAVLDRVIRAILTAFPAAQHGAIHLYDERSDTLCLRANTFGYSPSAIEALRLKPGEGITGWVFQHKQPVAADAPLCDPRYKRIDHPEVLNHKSIICVPLQVRNHVIGTLSLDNLDISGAFHADDLGLLTTFAEQVAIAIDNARRMEELEQLRQAAETMSRAAIEPRRALQQIVESASQVLHADSAAIWSYDEVRNRFVSEELAAVNIPRDTLEKFREEETQPGRTADAVMSRKYAAVTDISQSEDDFLGASTCELFDRIGVQSFQGIALQVGDEKLGVLYVNYNRPRTFDENDKAVLQMFANHAALALKNARLLDQVSKARDTAKVVAAVSALGDPQPPLDSIVHGTLAALGCDAVVLYTYNQEQDDFGFPPAMAGVRDEGEVLKLGRMLAHSLVRKILALGKVHEAEDARSDALMRGGFVHREGIQSSAGIPLLVGDHKVGVMFVNYRSRHRFTADEMANIEMFAHQAAVAIRNAQLYSDVKHRNIQLQTAARVSKSTSTILDPETLMKEAVKLIREGFDFYYVGLFLADEAHKDAVLRAGTDGAGLKMLEEKHRLAIGGRSMIGQCIENARARIALDVGTEAIRFENPHLPKTRSEMALPLIHRGRCIGALTVQSTQVAAFTQGDIAVLQTMADQLAIAIENARLYQAEQRRIQELSGLNSISQTIRLLTDIQQVYREVNRSVAQLAGAAMCAVLLYDQTQEMLICQLPMYGVPDEIGPRYKVSVGQGQTEAIWAQEDYLILNDVGEHPLVAALGLKELARDAGLRNTLLIKLMVGNRNIGVIQASNKLDGTPFGEDDARLLCIFAGQAAAVIENAQLYEELKRSQGIIGARTALAWMGMTSSTWRHAIDKHALTIRELAQLLRRDWERATLASDAKISERIATIERLATQILDKPITPPLSTEAGLTSVPLSALISERARQLWQNDPYKKITLRLDVHISDNVTVRASPEWLRRAFDILIDNAVTAVSGCPAQEITVGARAAFGGIEVFVVDTGPGIPEKIRSKIGLEYIEKPQDAEGLGMGLLMAQTIVQTFGGEIRVGATGPTGTTMIIWLPVQEPGESQSLLPPHLNATE